MQPQQKQLEYNDWYYSGSQAKVFFGNVWVDDIVTIQWDLVEQKAPLYGYASEKYDAVARGTQIVQGVFTIAFKHKDYITVILDHLNSRGEARANVLQRLRENKARKAYEARAQSRAQNETAFPKTTNYERILDDALREGSGADFQGMKTFLEDRIWGQISQGLQEQALDKDKLLQTIVSGFDVVVTYGNTTNHSSEWTSKTIADCHITGIRQLLNPTGEPILEAYTFFGKMLDPYRKDETARLSERASDPFGSEFEGHSVDTSELDLLTMGEDLENKEPLTDSAGNPFDDDPHDVPDNVNSNIVLRGVNIDIPSQHKTFWIVNDVLPTIDLSATAVGVPGGLQSKVSFQWSLTYLETQPPWATIVVDATGRSTSIDLDTTGAPTRPASLRINVTASYNGISVKADERTAVLLLQ
jgi:hypothetical protein